MACQRNAKKGFKWVVGDGKTINAREDPWIRGKEGCIPECQEASTGRVIKVRDLFVPASNSLDITKVRNLFSNCDAELVLAIPIPKYQVLDRFVWMNTIDCKHSAKSGYAYWYKHFSSSRQGLDHRGWRKLWKLEIPKKARVFLWRVCNNNILTRNMLRGRGVTTTILCPLCGVDVKHQLYIFLDCEFTKACWRRMGWEFNTLEINDLSEWLLHCLATKSKEKSTQIATVLWGVWRVRNLRVWEGKVESPEIAMKASCLQVSQWQDA